MAKKYRSENKDVINNKAKEDYKVNKNEILKRHILFNLNKSKNTTQPNQEPIYKYNLKHDDQFKRWY